MNLDRERQTGVEEFYQKRKIRLAVAASQKIRTALTNQFAQGRAGQRPLVDNALIRAMVADFPTLGIIVAGTDRFSQACFQAAVPPKIAPYEQAKTKRIKRNHGTIFSSSRRWVFAGLAARGAGRPHPTKQWLLIAGQRSIISSLPPAGNSSVGNRQFKVTPFQSPFLLPVTKLRPR